MSNSISPKAGNTICLDWRPFEKNTLLGFATIKICPWQVIINGVALHEKNGKRWVQLPARPQLDKAGELIREDDGRVRYAKVIEFSDRSVSDRFSDAVLSAVDDFKRASEAL